MKILQINVVCGVGSTGRNCVEIANLLEAQGHEAYIAYGQALSNYPNSFKYSRKWESKIHALVFSRILGTDGFGSYIGTYKLIKYIINLGPDVIHLGTLHGNHVNIPMLFKFLAKYGKPVVWTMHDCWPYTGKCTHYTSAKCYKWQTECRNCPQLMTSGSKNWLFDRTNYLYNKKKKLALNIPNLYITTVSKWLENQVRQSFFKERPIQRIYNWIDHGKFNPYYEDKVIAGFGIDRSKKIIVSVSALWAVKSSRFDDAMKLAKILPNEFQMVLVGKSEKKSLPDNVLHIPYINDAKKLAQLYSYADVFAGFSVEDTFGKVLAEAMACGTPCVVFNSTACPEIVGNTGLVVEPHDVEAMKDSIVQISNKGKKFYKDRCIDYVNSNFDYRANAQQYVDLYLSVNNKNE